MMDAAVERKRIPAFVWVALLWLLWIDFPTKIPVGPISASAVLTVLCGALGIFLGIDATIRRLRTRHGMATRTNPTHSTRVPALVGLFVTFAVVRLAVQPSVEGLQNVSVYAAFAGAIMATAASADRHTANTVLRAFQVCGCLIAIVWMISSALGIPIFGERSFALAALVALAATIPLPASSWWQRIAPFLIVAAIASSLSRTALAIALALLPFLALRGGRRLKLVRWILIAAAVGYAAWLALLTEGPLRNRFIVGDNALAIGGVRVNTSGRTEFWQAIIRSWESSPIIGHGPGSANALISSIYPMVGHPHNDYLRMLHDFGVIGLVLGAGGVLALALGAAGRAFGSKASDRPIHIAAALAILAVALAAVTDNVIVYPFVMIPTAVLVGASIGSAQFGAGRRWWEIGHPTPVASTRLGTTQGSTRL